VASRALKRFIFKLRDADYQRFQAVKALKRRRKLRAISLIAWEYRQHLARREFR
jgi:hypothetical protein